MTEKEKIEFVDRIRKELIEESHIYLSEEFADDTSEFMVEALEKQIPKKIKKHNCKSMIQYYCPLCEKRQLTSCIATKGNKYCMDCGQRLDWS